MWRSWLVLAACGGGAARPAPVPSGELPRSDERTVMATPVLDMNLPSAASQMAEAPVGDGKAAAVGYQLANEDAVVLVQRSPLDGGCPRDEEARGAAMERVVIGGSQAAVSVVEPTVVVAICKDTEFLVITATTKHPSATTLARMRAIALRAAETLRVSTRPAELPFQVTPAIRVRLPASAAPIAGPPETTMFAVPGAKGLSFQALEPRSRDDCATWLAKQERDLRAPPPADSRVVFEQVERTTVGSRELVIGYGRQVTKQAPLLWYANFAGATCMEGTPILMFAISLDGQSSEPRIPAPVAARLRAILERAAGSLAR